MTACFRVQGGVESGILSAAELLREWSESNETDILDIPFRVRGALARRGAGLRAPGARAAGSREAGGRAARARGPQEQSEIRLREEPVSIDCIAVEKRIPRNMYECSEPDCRICNDPPEYVKLVRSEAVDHNLHKYDDDSGLD